MEDSLWNRSAAYDAIVSPDGRYIAYVRFFPSHGADENAEDRVRMYDLSGTASSNRPLRSSDPPIAEVGVPIYPILKDEASRGNMDLPDADVYSVVSSLHWKPDSSRVIFGVNHGDVELGLVEAAPTGIPTSIADLNSLCIKPCQYWRFRGIKISDSGVSLDAIGFGKNVGAKKHLIIPARDFSQIR